mmetsp:Transcript_14630/g.38664  ORF Transcript_14630/g.38664 Transcript_14630/m.38664 type:complete len:107 (-) Transcript_14630:35-355(-)
MSVTTSFRKCRSCETTTSVCVKTSRRWFSSQITVSRSKWFVGSSRRSKPGDTNRAQARATRIRHPPDRRFVGRAMSSSSTPKPFRISLARFSMFFPSSPSFSSRRS